jgi:hypothetical protein
MTGMRDVSVISCGPEKGADARGISPRKLLRVAADWNRTTGKTAHQNP